MSSENVELARSIYAAWERGDFRRIDWAHPDISFSVEGAVDVPPEVRGIEALARAWANYLSAWDDLRTQADDYLDLDDRVLVLTSFSGRAKLSGVNVETFKGAALFVIRDGKVVVLRLYNSLDRALEEQGLSRDVRDR